MLATLGPRFTDGHLPFGPWAARWGGAAFVLTRITMGLAMAVAIVCVLVYTPPWGLAAVVLAATLAAAHEFQSIARQDADGIDRGLFTFVLLGVVSWPLINPHVPRYDHATALTLGFLLLAIARVLRPGAIDSSARRLALDALGLLYIGVTFPYIYLLRDRPDGGFWVITLMAIAFGGDTGAYFVGRFLGRHKLYPLLSPKKTIEGAFGGIAAGVGAAFIARTWLPGLGFLSPVDCVVLGVGGASLGVLGDLLESLFKRAYGVKDSGALIPGHGGILDRVDGLIFAGPFVYFYLETAARW